jgi:hypothetical protein
MDIRVGEYGVKRERKDQYGNRSPKKLLIIKLNGWKGEKGRRQPKKIVGVKGVTLSRETSQNGADSGRRWSRTEYWSSGFLRADLLRRI